jgi:hypothetical protein
MTEGREPGVLLEGDLDERLLERAFEAAAASPPAERVRSAVETAIEIVETDPRGAQEALSALRGDPGKLQRLERGLSMSPERATLAVGAAVQLAIAELGSGKPDLRARTEELVRWLEGNW